ncbi:MAG: hypothetical protein M3256_17830 [Actinomycetota bacterium]|nr:hypothetical protein [Actinomycetota bacterium]
MFTVELLCRVACRSSGWSDRNTNDAGTRDAGPTERARPCHHAPTGSWQRWKAWERDWTLNPCKYCDTHADAPTYNWKNGTVHRWWCPFLSRKLGWGALILPLWFRWLGLDWWFCIATGMIFLTLSFGFRGWRGATARSTTLTDAPSASRRS